jgi:hypothetical protein
MKLLIKKAQNKNEKWNSAVYLIDGWTRCEMKFTHTRGEMHLAFMFTGCCECMMKRFSDADRPFSAYDGVVSMRAKSNF